MYCGSCDHFTETPLHGYYCQKTGKEVGYLERKQCYTHKNQTPEMEEIKTKKCARCGRELPVTEFNRHAKAKDGLQPYCKECLSETMREARKRKEKAEEPDGDNPVREVLEGSREEFHAATPETDDRHGIPTALEEYTDIQLANELRRRGYVGNLTKKISIY